MRCCVCHLHHERATNAQGSVRKFFKKVFQHVYNFKVDVIAGDANAAAYKYYKNQKCQDLYNSSVAIMLREIQREVDGGPFEDRLCIDYNKKTFIPSMSVQQMILIVASWPFYHGESHQDPE